MRVLSRAWQMLLKGITEVEESGRPLAAAEMVLVRLAYAADLPTPDEVIRSLDGNGAAPAPRAGRKWRRASSATPASAAPRFEGSRGNDAPRGAPRAALASAQPIGDPHAAPAEATAPVLAVSSFEELIALAVENRDLSVKAALERDVRLVRCEDGRLDVALEPSATKTLVNDLANKFTQWTGRRWVVVVSRGAGAADGEVAARCPAGRAQDRRAGRSAGAGGDGALPGREDRRCARARPGGGAAGRRSATTCRWNRRPPTRIPMVRTGSATTIRRISRGVRWPISWA